VIDPCRPDFGHPRSVNGRRMVEPVERHRIYGAVPDAPNGLSRTAPDAPEMVELRARLADAQATIEDLRRQRDADAEERRRLTALLADRTRPPDPARRS
jgi:hypothetical protein